MTIQRPTLFTFCLLAPLVFGGLTAHAQSQDPSDCSKLPTRTQTEDCARTHTQTKAIFLTNTANQNDTIEIINAVRNAFDPGLKVTLLQYDRAIVVSTYPEQLARVEALIHTLDRPKKTYRLMYTVTELDGSKVLGTQHYSMVVVTDQLTTMKEGDKVPVATGSFSTENSGSQTQFQYIDVGMNFSATVENLSTGVSLKSKVEQSSIGQTNTIAGVQEPVVRQTVLEGTALLPFGKPVMLGSIDIPNSTHHFDIAVVLEDVK